MAELNRVKRVLVIGAGLTGICALRRLSGNKDYDLTCFERNYDIGGQWLYTDQTGCDDFGRTIQTAVYSNLRTNLPKQLIEIEGFPMDDYPSFPEKHHMLQYLHAIVDKSDILKYIKFNIEVTEIQAMNPCKPDTKWKVTYCDSRKKTKTLEGVFDVIIVCTGSCWTSKLPDVIDEKIFQGLVIHSNRYRRPEMYTGQTVAILGASFSGMDITFHLSKYAKMVYLCHLKSPIRTKLPDNVVEMRSGFKRFTPTSVILQNGEELFVDTVIYCTGFKYNYPFLPNGIINIDKHSRVTKLYQNIIPADYSSLLFIGIKKPVAFFPLADHQAQFVRAVLDGTANLPTRNEMQKIICEDTEKTEPDTQWEFDRQISAIAGNFKPLPPVLQKIWDYHFSIWSTDFATTRSRSYKVTGPNSFDVSCPDENKN